MTDVDVVTKLTNYFNLFDGTKKSLLDNRDTIDAVIDEKGIFHSAKGDIDHAQFIESIRELLDSGTKVEILEMKMHELGVEYRVRMQIPGQEEPQEVHSIGVLDHGKIIRIEPVTNAEAYNHLMGELTASE